MTATKLTIEADGGSRGNPGPAAYGALVRDRQGRVLIEAAGYVGETTNNVAEYRGLIAGLEAAREVDPAALVTARLDSKLVVEQMAGRWKIKQSHLAQLALEARRILPPHQIDYEWVPRAQNAAADALANEALDAAVLGNTNPIWRDLRNPSPEPGSN